MTTYQLIMTILAITFSIAGLIIIGMRIMGNGECGMKRLLRYGWVYEK